MLLLLKRMLNMPVFLNKVIIKKSKLNKLNYIMQFIKQIKSPLAILYLQISLIST